MIRALFLLLLMATFFTTANPVQAAPVVADISNYRIDIDSSFNGTRLFLFGTRNDTGDIVVVVRGPAKDYIVRKKEEIAGIWINRERMKFFGVPQFYAIASSRPLSDIEQANLFRQLGIGIEHLLIPPVTQEWKEKFPDFSKAFLDYQQSRKRFKADSENIQFMAETLFKMTIEFPDNIPAGNYTAEIYLVNGGIIIGMQSIPITVVKSGLDAFLHSYAHEHPALYGITAIVLALSIGWFAGRLFERI
jgi:uncharacterized protein (TIGR02186 family)